MNSVEVPEGVMNPILEPRTPGDGGVGKRMQQWVERM